MGRVAGFSYRATGRRLKQLGFEFHRQSAGSHEIWFYSATRRDTIPNHPGDMPEGTLCRIDIVANSRLRLHVAVAVVRVTDFSISR
jgi:predicted RNA binding protein YcfA (HicA-like mRNA interferase family)